MMSILLIGDVLHGDNSVVFGLFLIGNLVMSLLVFWDAKTLKKSGRISEAQTSPEVWWLGTVFFGLFGLLYYLVFRYLFIQPKGTFLISSNNNGPTVRTPRMDCPRCGESISKKAKVCRFCGEIIPRAKPKQKNNPSVKISFQVDSRGNFLCKHCGGELKSKRELNGKASIESICPECGIINCPQCGWSGQGNPQKNNNICGFCGSEIDLIMNLRKG